jgi:hypothetical protein
MKTMRTLFVLLAFSFLAAACVPVPALETGRSWTASPITFEPAGAREATGIPGSNLSTATRVPPTVRPRPTVAPTRRPSPTPAPSPTLDPHRVVITEADVRRSVASGAAAQQGAQVEGLDVRFTGGKMRITADRVGYGFVNVRDLVLVGRLVARDGQLQVEVDSVQPGGLVAAFIPSMVNQALAQYTSKWYVEDVHTLEGQLELRIR